MRLLAGKVGMGGQEFGGDRTHEARDYTIQAPLQASLRRSLQVLYINPPV